MADTRVAVIENAIREFARPEPGYGWDGIPVLNLVAEELAIILDEAIDGADNV